MPSSRRVTHCFPTLAIAVALAACASGPPAPAAIAETVPPDPAALEGCDDVAITFDYRSEHTDDLYGFFDSVRASGCPYARFMIAYNPGVSWSKSSAYSRARSQTRDYARSFGLPWRFERTLKDPRLTLAELKLIMLAPTAEDRALAEEAAARAAETAGAFTAAEDVPLKRTFALQLASRPQGLLSAALAEVCFAAALEGRSPYDVAAEAGYEPSGWIGSRYGSGDPADRGFHVAIGKRVYVITRPGADICAVNAREGDPMTLASYALGALDAVASEPYAGDCPPSYVCRALPDGRVMLMGLRLAGNDAPPENRASRAENVGAARVLAGALTPEQVVELAATLPGGGG